MGAFNEDYVLNEWHSKFSMFISLWIIKFSVLALSHSLHSFNWSGIEPGGVYIGIQKKDRWRLGKSNMSHIFIHRVEAI